MYNIISLRPLVWNKEGISNDIKVNNFRHDQINKSMKTFDKNGFEKRTKKHW